MTDALSHRVLLTGATGYIGGRLIRPLVDRGYQIRCLSRHPEHLQTRCPDDVQVVAGDVLNADTLAPAFENIHTAFYLIHSMGSTGDFVEQDRRAARNFADAARAAGVQRIIYLGGLGSEQELSSHLASRQEVGSILRSSGITTLELRASIIIGSGSLSFEMVRALVRRLPIMTTPRWVRSLSQPIAIEDVIAYLLASIELRCDQSRIYEIGGADRVSYADLLREFARQRGLKRLIIPVPLLTPGLSSLWLGLVTPLYARIGRKLIDSVRHDTVALDGQAMRDFDIKPMGYARAIERAMANEDQEYAQTRWSNAVSSSGRQRHWGGVKFGQRLIDQRSINVHAPPEHAFHPIQRIGGNNGWYFGNWLWRLRGAMDLLIGGVGMRRGRTHPVEIHPGDALDFWRVEAVDPPNLLRLRAEMKLPGRGWLQYEVESVGEGISKITQTAIYDPIGLFGSAYWYSMWPMHQLVFNRMLKAIARKAEALNGDASQEAPLRGSR